jgi:hypothetical protein
LHIAWEPPLAYNSSSNDVVSAQVNQNFYRLRSNQSLKLTEMAIDDFGARRRFFKEMAMPAARIVYTELAARRRSLAPVRYASLAAGGFTSTSK